jgi:CheY-like chemotaxis protein
VRAHKQPITLLIADDDSEDRMLAKYALCEARLANDVRFVNDGEELLHYLQRRGSYAPPAPAPRPGLILLDLGMPKKDGREALTEIRQDPFLSRIPIVGLASSQAEENIFRTYGLGVRAFIIKPVSFQGLVSAIWTLGHHLFEIVASEELDAADNDGRPGGSY